MSNEADPTNVVAAHAGTADGLPVSPALELVAESAHVPTESPLVAISSRSDIVNAYRRTGEQHQLAEPTIRFGAMSWGRPRNSTSV
jgi:hypothetical protein